MTVLLYGRHACYAALLNPKRKIELVFITQQTLDDIDKDAAAKQALSRLGPGRVLRVEKEELDRILANNDGRAASRPTSAAHQIGGKSAFPAKKGKEARGQKPYDALKAGFGATHQGIVVEAQPLACVPLESLNNPQKANQIVLVLDHITDPQNIGSIFRLGGVFNVDAVIMTARNAPKETGAMAKVASGAIETVPRCVVPNLADAMRSLKGFGFWCVGLTEHATQSIREVDLSGKIALIMGSEGEGMRHKTESICDFNAFLPTSPCFSTLNVTTATAIALYETFVAQNNHISSPRKLVGSLPQCSNTHVP
ncbi:MAG: RNA methyltransferase [Holosporales bacterium]|jgi:23S rRNA (guanosine2251-2'-O)-methyltransferase|nr:RNA methyltransferase [Holosporales bacterium]